MYTDDELDDIIRAALAEKEARVGGGPPEEVDVDDGQLRRWVEAELSEAEQARLEIRLAEQAELRALALEQRAPVSDGLASWAMAEWAGAQTTSAEADAAPHDPLDSDDQAATSAEAPAPRSTSRGWYLAAAAVALLAVGGALWSQRGVDLGPMYTAGPLEGSARIMRADGPETGVFLPDSQVRIKLTPAAERPLPEVTVFVGPVAGPLRRAAMDADFTMVEGFGGVFRLKARAGDLLGERFGDSLIAISLGPWPDPPATLIPGFISEDDDHQWLRLPVDYRETLDAQEGSP